MTKANLLYVLSPAKTLDFSRCAVQFCSNPTQLHEANNLMQELRTLSKGEVKNMMKVSDALADLNYHRFQNFTCYSSNSKNLPTAPNDSLKQAILAFNGPAYQGLEADEWKLSDYEYAQEHLRILCGLYSLLRPMDLIQPYRLEMGTKLDKFLPKVSSLYNYWKPTMIKAVNDFFTHKGLQNMQNILVNVASEEYFRSLPIDDFDDSLNIQVIHIVFKDDGKVKQTYAKRARGLMVKYLVTQRVESLDGIKNFNLEGYKFDSKGSNDGEIHFTRSSETQKKELVRIQAKAARKKLEKQNMIESMSGTQAAIDKIEEEDRKPKKQRTSASRERRYNTRNKH